MKISELPELTELTGAEYLVVQRGDGTYKASLSLLVAPAEPEPDDPPAAPNALDDEFELGALNADWLWVNQAATTAIVEDGKLRLSKPNSGSGNNISYLFKAPPAAPLVNDRKNQDIGY